MTTEEMLDTLLYSLRMDGDVEIVESPRPVPHGGMAVDVREYQGKFFYKIRCYQVYGTSEVLENAEAILQDENICVELGSSYLKKMRFYSRGRIVSGIASIKAFPMEEECMTHMRELEEKTRNLGYFSNYVMMNEDGYFRFLSDIKE